MGTPNASYFLSDTHLGAIYLNDPIKHEKKVATHIRTLLPQAKTIYLLGDIFDFWYEYKRTIPKGFARFLGVMTEFVDGGGEVHFLVGNHDLWIKDYFQKELGWQVHYDSYEVEIDGKLFYLTHGDMLENSSFGYKFLNRLFRNKPIQRTAEFFVPHSRMLQFGYQWSKQNRLKKGIKVDNYQGFENEYQLQFANQLANRKPYDYIIMGHRHIPMTKKINDTTTFVNLGDWLSHCTYAEFVNNELNLIKIDSDRTSNNEPT